MVCVGLDHRDHILEMGRDLPDHPTLFIKDADTLVGANDDIVEPPETDAFDWECELAVVIGAPLRRARGADVERAIAGFAVRDNVTCRTDPDHRDQRPGPLPEPRRRRHPA